MIIYISGEPIGKGRPRFAKRGSFVSAYTPEKTKAYEDHVKECFDDQHCYDKEVEELRDKPLRICITAYMGIPKSTSKGKAQDMRIGKTKPTKKPDVDNIAKIILDALNGIAYEDDKQVVELLVQKKYSEQPHVVVELTEVK